MLTNSARLSDAEVSSSRNSRSNSALSSAEELAISVKEVSKKYSLWRSPSARLWHPFLGRIASSLPGRLRSKVQKKQEALSNDFFALSNVSLQVRPGESVGIIGRNGSGKSTLLQLIAGTLTPTTGTVETRGQIAALLELGSGFNPEFTGRENVFLNAAILGLTHSEVDERFDEIAGFADIGEFIDQPVKTYSSGMIVRLAFSVAAHVEAEILIVDEALAVGDLFFQQKCYRKIREILDRGVTFLFVSHDAAAVQSLCKRGILLQHGKIEFDGPADQCGHKYMRETFAPANLAQRVFQEGSQKENFPREKPAGRRGLLTDEDRSNILSHNLLGSAKARHGKRVLEYLAASLVDQHGEHVARIPIGGQGTISLLLRANEVISNPEVAIRLIDRLANTIFCTCNSSLREDLGDFSPGDEIIVSFEIQFSVDSGQYTLTLETGKRASDRPNMGVYFDVVEGIGPLTIYDPAPDQIRPFYGMAQLPCKMTLR